MAKTKKIERSSSGLKAVLFEELQLLRDGKSEVGKANATAKLVNSIIGIAELELRIVKGMESKDRKPEITFK